MTCAPSEPDWSLAGAAGLGLVVVVGAAVVGGALVVGATVVVGAAVVGAAVVGGLVEVTPSAACARSSPPPLEQAPSAKAATSPNETTAAAPCLVRVSFSHLRVVGCCCWSQWYQSDRAHAVAGM